MTDADVHPFQTNVDDEIPFPRLQVHNVFGWVDLHAGRVDEDVDGAEMFDDLGDCLGDVFVVGDIRCDGKGFDFLGRKASCSGFRLIKLKIEYSERSSMIGKPAGKRTSQRAATAGDEHHFVLQPEVAHLSSGFKVQGSKFRLQARNVEFDKSSRQFPSTLFILSITSGGWAITS